MQPVYISAVSTLSPQHSFDDGPLLQEIRNSDNGKLYVVDTDYSTFINPVAIRRMSRMLKIGISAGMRCFQKSGIQKLDGIVTGTGRGSMRDMELFLGDMIKMNEEALNPTYFIQSTYNSVNGWLAMLTKCTGYNQTYVHRGHSLEMALLDAQLMLNETNKSQHYLVGCLDEMTEEYFFVKNKKGYWKQPIPNSLDIFKHSDTPGSIAGEGASFFMVTNEHHNALAKIAGICMLQNPDAESIHTAINKILADVGLNIKDIDIVMCGLSGDNRFEHLYTPVLQNMTAHTSIAVFKHLCGEYDTSTGFAIWLATELFKSQQIPEVIIQKKGIAPAIKNILIVNHYILNSASVILLQQ